jgi:hypothetical protein
MKLARRAFFAAPGTLTQLRAAQPLLPGNNSPNHAPTVGTGGPAGDPTGLFTIYVIDTLRKGEFTFSIAYSNYDRDPGNAPTLDKGWFSKRLENFSCSKLFAALQCRRLARVGRGIADRASVISPSALSPCLNLLLSG